MTVRYFPDPAFRLIKRIDYLSPKNDDAYQAYQAYYLSGLIEKVPVRHVRIEAGDAAPAAARGESDFALPYGNHIGQYRVVLQDGRTVKVAIDAHDHRETRSPKTMEWSDLYFKSNKWPSASYEEKVRPIVNGNGDLSGERISLLMALRNEDKLYDFVFVSRIWAGGDANVEHNLLLFEKLAQVKARSKMLAVMAGFESSDPTFISYRDRLEKAGVAWTRGHMDYRELMMLTAQSKCTVSRAGISSCIPWRMLDLLCIGACIVADNDPFPRWPVPLAEHQNFLSLKLRIHPDARPAPIEDYEGIVDKMDRFLGDAALQQKIRENNRAYFDDQAHPVKIAEYIARAVCGWTRI